MGGLKTYLLGICASLALAGAAFALPASPIERVKVFATCAGRLSALEQYQWMFDGPASERTARRIAAFDDILAALLPYAADTGLPDRQALIWRVAAKTTQAGLMQDARFATDPRRAGLAAKAAEAALTACDGLLLGV